MKKIHKYYPKLTINGCDPVLPNVKLEEKLEILSQSIDVGCDRYNFDIKVKEHNDKFVIDNYVSPTPSWKPTDIQGCVLWLPADGDNVWQDAAKTIPCGNGDYVYTFEDLSGNGNDAIQLNIGNRPVLITNQLNAKPIIRFTTVEYLSLLSNINVQVSSVFIVCKGQYGVIGRISGGLTTYQYWVDGNFYLADEAGGSYNAVVWSVNSNYTIIEIIKNGQAVSGYEKGLLVQNWSQTTPGTYIVNTIGGGYDLSRLWSGDIGEVIIYDSSFGASDRLLVESYLGSKYALP